AEISITSSRDQGSGSRAPDNSEMTCGTSEASVAMPSRTAAREPARLTTSVLPEIPTRPREMPASTAPADSPEERSASAMPGMVWSSTPWVASGVTSRGDTPVPPTVITRSAPPITAVFKALRMETVSPGTLTVPSTMKPTSFNSSVTSGPVVSSTSPLATRSSTTTTNALPNRCAALRSMAVTLVGGRAATRSEVLPTRSVSASARRPAPPAVAPRARYQGSAEGRRSVQVACVRYALWTLRPVSSVARHGLGPQRDLDRAAALQGQDDLLPWRPGPHRGHQLVGVLDPAVTDLHHHVALLEPSLRRRGVLQHADDLRPAVRGVADHRADVGMRSHTGTYDLVRGAARLVDRDGEADADVADPAPVAGARRAVDGRVDADHPAVHVHQRA